MINRSEEKRVFERVELRADLRYQKRGCALEFANAVSSNVSLGGIGLNVNSFIRPDTTLNLEFDLLSRVLHPIGKVAWCDSLPHSNKHRLGIEFVEFDTIERNYLEDFIKMQTGKI